VLSPDSPVTGEVGVPITWNVVVPLPALSASVAPDGVLSML